MSLRRRAARLEETVWLQEAGLFREWQAQASKEELAEIQAYAVSYLIQAGRAPELKGSFLDLPEEERERYWSRLDPGDVNAAIGHIWITCREPVET